MTVTDDPPISAHIGDPLALLCSQQARQIDQLRLALMQVTTINPAAVIDWENPVATMRELAAYVAALKLELAEARASAPAGAEK